ncbi:hypothetical protein TNCV_4088261 [Trichonephila clavipes]|nr:hypothetical protein TNCV_4088261 [Trichonephila clavipes]
MFSGLGGGCPPPNSKTGRAEKSGQFMEIKKPSKIPLQFRTDPFKLQGWVTFTPLATSHWRGHTFAPGAPDCIPPPLVSVNNRPKLRLISPPKQNCVQRLDAIIRSVIFSLSVRL